VAGNQARVLWQISQEALVGRWSEGLPLEIEPLWQVLHWPGLTVSWLNVAGVQARVLWQLSQLADVGR
jgi:hypothetical protein